MIIPVDIIINKPLHPDDIKLLEDLEASERILYEKNTHFNLLKVTENNYGRFLKFDDSYQAGMLFKENKEINFPYINYFLTSCLLNQNIENILFLGMGSGKLIESFNKICPNLKSIDIVEIDPEVIETAINFFDFKQNEKTQIHIQDAAIFVRETQKAYDLIILDVFSAQGLPYRLITDEFAQDISNILNPNGVLATNMFSSTDLNSKNNILFKAILKTFNQYFNDMLVIPTLSGNDELYKQILGLQHALSDLTNVIVFFTNNSFNLKNLSNQAITIKNQLNLTELNSIDKYVNDVHFEKIDVDKIKVLKAEYENVLTLQNIKDFLYIDHEDEQEKKSLNPMVDETHR